MINIIIGQDGGFVEDEALNFPFNPGDIKYSKKYKKNIYDFVGFIINDKNMLAVFPKHYNDDCIISTEEEKKENVSLLFKVIKKYITEEYNNQNGDKYFGYENNYESDYPFSSFFKVYNYYKKYGIYKEENMILEKNTNGNISWKDTIQKSNAIVNNNGIIFLPIYSKRKNNNDNFISQCMEFVINYTIKSFPFFIDFPMIKNSTEKTDFLLNREYTLRKLYSYKSHIFKDAQKELIDSLISFFEQYDKKKRAGNIHIKLNYFELIWEKMVNKYLNDCFEKVDDETKIIEFSSERNIDKKSFSHKQLNVDKSEHNFSINPDHYLTEDDKIYVFDSKYYNEINDMNYKQFTYNVLIGNNKMSKEKILYSALLLPGLKENSFHLNLVDEFGQDNDSCNFIIEQYLPVKTIMKNYLNLDLKQ